MIVPRLATLAGAGAILIWATLALLTRMAATVPPLQITTLSFSVSAVLGLPLLAWRGELSVLRQPARAWLHGVGGLFGYHALYFAALGLAPVAEANLLNYTWPLLIVMFSSMLLGMRLSRSHWAGLLLGTTGCALLLAHSVQFGVAGRAILGYVFAVGAGIAWALYSVFSRNFSAVPTGALVRFRTATAGLAGIAHLVFERNPTPDTQAWLAIGAMGTGPGGAAFFLWDMGVR